MKSICLYGGAFDPVHNGHIHFSKEIIKAFEPELFFFVPARYSPFKGRHKFADDSHRLNMLDTVVRLVPHAHVCRAEIDREGLSYTIDTLKFFHELYPGFRLFWIIGDDHLPLLDTWKGYPEHFMYCDLIILPREPSEGTEEFIKTHPYRDQLHPLHAETVPVSSSLIRARIAEDKSILSYVPKEINDYIVANKLYR